MKTSEKILGFRENQQKEQISEETWKKKYIKRKIGKRKCKQEQIETTENQYTKQYAEINNRIKRSIR